ncbi:glycosyltransferase family 2 protein [Pedobacter sp. UC225_61]|uniref:glycosyltransferase family 2 protein n=1 Tax=Pedobacter sp. UC225_61 TaxID=3374623 RepID=UPI0037A680E0
MIKFTCIITCYNREDLIQRSIKSILNQSFQDFEIIIVDDGSTDKSIERIKLILDKRIKLIIHEKNSGQNAAINTGIAASKYDYLAFLDSDDEWLPEYLHEMYLTYLKNPAVGFAYTFCDEVPSTLLEGEKMYADVLNKGYLSAMIAITARKDAVLAIGKFDERYTICQDDDFCFRLAKNYAFKAIPKKLAVIHGAPDSMTKNLLKLAEGFNFLFENYKEDILINCGGKTLSKHYLDISIVYFRAKALSKGYKFYFKSLNYYLFSKGTNRFKFPLNQFLKKTIFILRINLSHIKQFILGNHGRRG